MTAPDLAYVALVVDKPAASAAIFGKAPGLLRRAFACGGSRFRCSPSGARHPRRFAGPTPAMGRTPGMASVMPPAWPPVRTP